MTEKKVTPPSKPDAKAKASKAKPASKPASKAASKPSAPSTAQSTAQSTGKIPKGAAPDTQKKKGSGIGTALIMVLIAAPVVYFWPQINAYIDPQERPWGEAETSVISKAAKPITPVVPAQQPVIKQTPTLTPAPAPEPTPTLNSDTTENISEVARRLEVLESQLNGLSNADGQAALRKGNELAQTLSALESQLGEISARLSGLEQAVQANQAQLQNGSGGAGSATAQTLVLATTQLRSRLMGDASFAAELNTLEHLAKDDQVVLAFVDALRPFAITGIPSTATLNAQFPPLATQIMRAHMKTGGVSWLETLQDGISGLITVRRTDPSKIDDTVERAVAIAQASLKAGNISGAVQALNPLTGFPADAAAEWLAGAHAREIADVVLENLHNHVLAVLANRNGA